MDEALGWICFIACVTMVFANTWEMTAVGGAVALGCVAIHTWKETHRGE